MSQVFIQNKNEHSMTIEDYENNMNMEESNISKLLKKFENKQKDVKNDQLQQKSETKKKENNVQNILKNFQNKTEKVNNN